MATLLAPYHYTIEHKAALLSVAQFILENHFILEKCFDMLVCTKTYQYQTGSPQCLCK